MNFHFDFEQYDFYVYVYYDDGEIEIESITAKDSEVELYEYLKESMIERLTDIAYEKASLEVFYRVHGEDD